MDCEQIQEEILESLVEARPAAILAMVDAHLVTCSTCAGFAARQARIDAGLTTALATPVMSRRALAAVRDRIRRETPPAWPDLLPDIVHFASCGVVTLVSLVLLPFNASAVLTIAAGATILSHAVLTAVHGSWEAAGDRY